MTATIGTAGGGGGRMGTQTAAASGAVPDGIDPLYYALHLVRTRQLDRSIAVAAQHLARVPSQTFQSRGADDAPVPAPSKFHKPVIDEQMWYIQTKAMVLNSWYDDVELEGDVGGDDLENDYMVSRSTAAQNPRTSLLTAQRGGAGLGTAGGKQRGTAVAGSRAGTSALSLAPTAGRPISSRYGFARPGTLGQQRPGQLSATGGGGTGVAGGRAGTGVPGSRRAGGTAFRPITGRVLRLGTASLQSVPGGPHIHLERLSLEKYARGRPMVAKLLCDYLLYVEHRPRLAVELCMHALKMEETVKAAQLAEEKEGGSNLSGSGDGGRKLPSGVHDEAYTNIPAHRVMAASVLSGKSVQEVIRMTNQEAAAAGRPHHESRPDHEGGNEADHRDAGIPQEAGTTVQSGHIAPRYQPQVGIPISQDWWWKARLGKANYQLGLLREAEKWLKASLYDEGSEIERDNGGSDQLSSTGGAGRKRSPLPQSKMSSSNSRSVFRHYHPSTVMELCKVYLKMDQPLTAMDLYRKAIKENPTDPCTMLCLARLQDELHDQEGAFVSFASVLSCDSSNVEAIACVAAFYFFEKNQPEMALRYYRRLLQMGVDRAEVWNNIALSAYLTSQYDFALSCFERSLLLCEDDATRADVWYNIGHVGTALGDFAFAERALRIAVALDPTHGEALNNLAVLALERNRRYLQQHQQSSPSDENASGNYNPHRAEAKAALAAVLPVAPFLEEALYNSALLAYEDGELETAHQFLSRVLEAHPGHPEAWALITQLRELLTIQ